MVQTVNFTIVGSHIFHIHFPHVSTASIPAYPPSPVESPSSAPSGRFALRSKGIPPLKDALINEPEDHLKASWMVDRNPQT